MKVVEAEKVVLVSHSQREVVANLVVEVFDSIQKPRHPNPAVAAQEVLIPMQEVVAQREQEAWFPILMALVVLALLAWVEQVDVLQV